MKREAVVNEVRVMDEAQGEAEADAIGLTKTTTDQDKIQLIGVPSKSEYNAVT